MEELRSTEILDREIREDARRKAEKILKASEAECAQILAAVSERVERTRAEKTAEYAARLESYARDSASAIPLEKQRKLVSFIDGAVQEALDAWLAGIGASRRLELFANQLKRYADVLSGKKILVSYAGYPEDDIRALVARVFGEASIVSLTCLPAQAALASGFSDGVFVEAEDHSLLCRATVDEIRAELLSGHRQELAEALLGGRLPQ